MSVEGKLIVSVVIRVVNEELSIDFDRDSGIDGEDAR